MQTMTSKKSERLERKKKKLAALANVVKLNDKDRNSTATATSQSESDSPDETKKVKKAKMPAPQSEEEPATKKLRLNSDKESHDAESDASSMADEYADMKVHLTEEQYAQLKKDLKKRKRELENIPKFHLRPAGFNATLEVQQSKRTSIFLTDVQHLLMYALIGDNSPCKPERWCYLEKPMRLSHTVVLVLEGVSLYHFLSNENQFAETNKIFETKLEVMLPAPKEGSIIQDLVTAPLTNAQAEELIKKYGCLETAIEMTKDPSFLVKSIFSVKETPTNEIAGKLPKSDKFPRTKLLLSALQMVDEGYPMPLRGELTDRFGDYVFTNDKYAPVTAMSPMFGVDCEMCRTTTGQNELTRISIVNEKYETVYETLVMPRNKIVDYLTQYSGITPELMKTVTKSLSEVQKDVRNLLPPDAILVGQSLNSDLNAMKMMHPYVIDTSVIFNITGQRKRKSKLQILAKTFLGEEIQEQAGGHDSVEDSLASIRLVHLKLKNDLDFGDEVLSQKKRTYEIIRLTGSESIKNNLFGQVSARDKCTAIVKSGSMQSDVKDLCSKAALGDKLRTISIYEEDGNKEAVKKAREIALDHALTIANLSVDASKFQMDKVEKTISKVDKWISKLWKSVAHNGLFVVLLGGSEDSPSGLLKIAIKKNPADVAGAHPISV